MLEWCHSCSLSKQAHLVLVNQEQERDEALWRYLIRVRDGHLDYLCRFMAVIGQSGHGWSESKTNMQGPIPDNTYSIRLSHITKQMVSPSIFCCIILNLLTYIIRDNHSIIIVETPWNTLPSRYLQSQGLRPAFGAGDDGWGFQKNNVCCETNGCWSEFAKELGV